MPYDIITDHDLHAEGQDLLRPYNVVLTGSHPEYWSLEMLDALDGYQRQGGRHGDAVACRITFRDRLRRVEQQVRHHLRQPGPVAADADARGTVDDELGAVGDLARHEPAGIIDDHVNRDDLRGPCLGAGKVLQVANDSGDALQPNQVAAIGLARLRNRRAHLVRYLGQVQRQHLFERPFEYLQVREHERGGVVDFVRDASGELANGRKPFRPPHLLLERPLALVLGPDFLGQHVETGRQAIEQVVAVPDLCAAREIVGGNADHHVDDFGETVTIVNRLAWRRRGDAGVSGHRAAPRRTPATPGPPRPT